MNRIKCGRIKQKKEGKKCVYKPEDLEAALTEIRGLKPKKVAAKEYIIPKFTFQFRLSSKFSKYSMGPLPVLSEDEEQLLIKWIIDCSQKRFPQSKLDVQPVC